MFSIANLFSMPISQAMPKGRAEEGARVSLRIGIRAFGRGLTWARGQLGRDEGGGGPETSGIWKMSLRGRGGGRRDVETWRRGGVEAWE